MNGRKKGCIGHLSVVELGQRSGCKFSVLSFTQGEACLTEGVPRTGTDNLLQAHGINGEGKIAGRTSGRIHDAGNVFAIRAVEIC